MDTMEPPLVERWTLKASNTCQMNVAKYNVQVYITGFIDFTACTQPLHVFVRACVCINEWLAILFINLSISERHPLLLSLHTII